MTSRSYGGRTAEERRADRRARLIDSATELFGTDGYAATPIERICTKAGVSTRNFYEEFESRESLLMEVHKRLSTRVWTKVIEALAGLEEATLQERANVGLRAYVRETVNDPMYVRIIYLEIIGVSRAMEDYRFKEREKWTQIVDLEVQRAISRGEVLNGDHSLATIGWIGAVNEITHYWWRSGRSGSMAQLEAELIHFAEVCLADLLTPSAQQKISSSARPEETEVAVAAEPTLNPEPWSEADSLAAQTADVTTA